MPLRDSIPESHVLAAAAPKESTMQILKAAESKPKPGRGEERRPINTFIEDVETWVRKYLKLADEVLETPAESRGKGNDSAA